MREQRERERERQRDRQRERERDGMEGWREPNSLLSHRPCAAWINVFDTRYVRPS